MEGTIFYLSQEIRRHLFGDEDQRGCGGGGLEVSAEGVQIAFAVLMSALDEDYPALGHAGKGVAGIDDLRWPSLARIIRGEIEFSQLGEEGIDYFPLSPFYEIPLIPVEEIEWPGLALGQFLFQPCKICPQVLKPLFDHDIDLFRQISRDLLDGVVFVPLIDHHVERGLIMPRGRDFVTFPEDSIVSPADEA